MEEELAYKTVNSTLQRAIEAAHASEYFRGMKDRDACTASPSAFKQMLIVKSNDLFICDLNDLVAI